MLIPSAQYKPDADDEVITQWHGGGGLPLLSVFAPNQTICTLELWALPGLILAPLIKSNGITYVFHMNHSSGSDGLVEIWREGQKIINRSGQNMYLLTLGSDYHLPQWKMGIYKPGWNCNKTTSTNLRVVYLNGIKYGNAYAAYEEMAPIPSNQIAGRLQRAVVPSREKNRRI